MHLKKRIRRTLSAALLALVMLTLIGCGARSAFICDSRVLDTAGLRDIGPRPDVAVLPFAFSRGVPENFAQSAGERLAESLLASGINAIGPADALSYWAAAGNSPWVQPTSSNDFKRLGNIIPSQALISATVARYVYGSINPSEVSFDLLLIDPATGRTIVKINANGRSRKGRSYTAISKPAESPEMLQARLMDSVAAALLELLDASKESGR
ncbi:hypothetical protein J7M28_13975 [bacterium]|nr:hypothetical protein [bacterium]